MVKTDKPTDQQLAEEVRKAVYVLNTAADRAMHAGLEVTYETIERRLIDQRTKLLILSPVIKRVV